MFVPLKIIFSNYKKHDKNISVNLNVVTFSKLELIEKYAKNTERKNILELPQYYFTEENEFKRKLKDENVSKKDIYVQKTLDCFHRNLVTYLKFGSLQDFENSKVGVLHTFLSDIKYYLSDYMQIKYYEIYPHKVIKNVSNKLLFSSEKEFYKNIDKKGIHIMSCLEENELYTRAINELKKGLESLKVKNISSGNEFVKGKYHIIPIHSREYYAQNNMSDPHNDTMFGQHMILDNYISIDDKNNKINVNIPIASIKNVLYETAIREDIFANQLSLYKWQDYKTPVTYIKIHRQKTLINEKKHTVVQFLSLTIEPSGNMTYREINDNSSAEYKKLYDYIEGFKVKHVRGSDLKMIIYDEHDTVLLFDNHLATVPDNEKITERLENYAKDYTIETAKLKEIIVDFMYEFPQHTEKCEQGIHKLCSSDKLFYSYEEICNAYQTPKDNKNQKSKKQIVPIFRLSSSGMTQDFVKFTREKYGIILNPVLKNKDSENIITTAFTNINIFKRPEDKDNALYYFVGSKKSINKFDIKRACRIRGLYPLNTNNILIDKITEQMNIDFVKQGEFSVYPFPLKYINEYKILTEMNCL